MEAMPSGSSFARRRAWTNLSIKRPARGKSDARELIGVDEAAMAGGEVCSSAHGSVQPMFGRGSTCAVRSSESLLFRCRPCGLERGRGHNAKHVRSAMGWHSSMCGNTLSSPESP